MVKRKITVKEIATIALAVVGGLVLAAVLATSILVDLELKLSAIKALNR